MLVKKLNWIIQLSKSLPNKKNRAPLDLLIFVFHEQTRHFSTSKLSNFSREINPPRKRGFFWEYNLGFFFLELNVMAIRTSNPEGNHQLNLF